MQYFCECLSSCTDLSVFCGDPTSKRSLYHLQIQTICEQCPDRCMETCACPCALDRSSAVCFFPELKVVILTVFSGMQLNSRCRFNWCDGLSVMTINCLLPPPVEVDSTSRICLFCCVKHDILWCIAPFLAFQTNPLLCLTKTWPSRWNWSQYLHIDFAHISL